jgi:hypothetical protein
MEFYSTTLKRHTLVLRKRDIMRKKAEEERDNEISRLLAAEGLELDTDEDENKTFWGNAFDTYPQFILFHHFSNS